MQDCNIAMAHSLDILQSCTNNRYINITNVMAISFSYTSCYLMGVKIWTIQIIWNTKCSRHESVVRVSHFYIVTTLAKPSRNCWMNLNSEGSHISSFSNSGFRLVINIQRWCMTIFRQSDIRNLCFELFWAHRFSVILTHKHRWSS